MFLFCHHIQDDGHQIVPRAMVVVFAGCTNSIEMQSMMFQLRVTFTLNMAAAKTTSSFTRPPFL
jgi:hypothetical protein